MGYRNVGAHLFSDGWDSEDYTNGGIVHATGLVAPGNTLILGVDARHQGGRVFTSDFAGKWDKLEYAVFAHDEQIFLGRLILTLGARYNKDEMAGGELSPQAGVVFHMGQTTILRGIVNKGFRAPQINELYIFPPRNQNLKAETVWNYEIGLHRLLWPGIDLDVAAFRMDGRNLIETAPHPAPPPKFLFQNIGAFHFQGVEAGLALEPIRSLQAAVSYTYLDPGEKTTGRPGDKVDISTQWTSDRITLSVIGQYVGNYFAADQSHRPIPDFFVWDLKLRCEIITGVEISLAIDNILDDTYAIYANLPGSAAGLYTMPRRRATTGLTVRL
jgi:iron complex outermembrane receptor protein